jgi:hypothetical protein
MEERSAAMRCSAPQWRSTIVVTALIGTALPRRARWLWWPAGAGRRGLVIAVVTNTLLGFGLRELLRRYRVEYDAIVAEARARVGREPTRDELVEEYARRSLRRSLGREPTEEEVEAALRGGEG